MDSIAAHGPERNINVRLAADPAWKKTVAVLDATRLMELGARTGLICHLTKLDRKTANRLYRQIYGRPSPPGQFPFSDAWFLKSERRMLHAAIVWRIHKHLRETNSRPARILIDVYEIYRQIIQEDLLGISQVAFVPRILEMQLWHERQCPRCLTEFISPVEETDASCPGCRLHHRFRCRYCGGRAEGLRRGRRPATCRHCGAARDP
ncbi:MAG: FlhC family transcriptional regulator [Gammaproteobacteria bacterium]|nr:FlhC family transcriptional regulator [Gammaproteobacteria bacterium]